MDARAPRFAIYAGGQPGRGDPPGAVFQELWLSLARRRWSSLVVVPVGAAEAAADVATSLADVGTRLRGAPVTAIVADDVDFDVARSLAQMQGERGDELAWPEATSLETTVLAAATGAGAAPGHDPGPEPRRLSATLLPPLGRIVIAVQPVVEQPLGAAIARAADAVLLTVELGRSRLRDARRTVELVGAERIAGALLVR